MSFGQRHSMADEVDGGFLQSKPRKLEQGIKALVGALRKSGEGRTGCIVVRGDVDDARSEEVPRLLANTVSPAANSRTHVHYPYFFQSM